MSPEAYRNLALNWMSTLIKKQSKMIPFKLPLKNTNFKWDVKTANNKLAPMSGHQYWQLALKKLMVGYLFFLLAIVDCWDRYMHA